MYVCLRSQFYSTCLSTWSTYASGMMESESMIVTKTVSMFTQFSNSCGVIFLTQQLMLLDLVFDYPGMISWIVQEMSRKLDLNYLTIFLALSSALISCFSMAKNTQQFLDLEWADRFWMVYLSRSESQLQLGRTKTWVISLREEQFQFRRFLQLLMASENLKLTQPMMNTICTYLTRQQANESTAKMKQMSLKNSTPNTAPIMPNRNAQNMTALYLNSLVEPLLFIG